MATETATQTATQIDLSLVFGWNPHGMCAKEAAHDCKEQAKCRLEHSVGMSRADHGV